MSLDRGIGIPTEQAGGDILFPMNDGALRILCRVTGEALNRLAGARFPTARRSFDAVRLRIEHIASSKYDNGSVEIDGGVTIRPVDVGDRR
jgi:uncharacterized protein DUF1488